MSTLLYIMTTRSGFLLTPITMTLNDLECPIHLKVRFMDGTLDVRMFWLTKCLRSYDVTNVWHYGW